MIKSLHLYFTAVIIYMFLTLPLITHPTVYVLSLSLTLIYGWIAWAFFAMMYALVKKLRLETESKWILLFASVPVAIAIAYQCIGFSKRWPPVWQWKSYAVFPFIAVIAVYLAMREHRTSIHQELTA